MHVTKVKDMILEELAHIGHRLNKECVYVDEKDIEHYKALVGFKFDHIALKCYDSLEQMKLPFQFDKMLSRSFSAYMDKYGEAIKKLAYPSDPNLYPNMPKRDETNRREEQYSQRSDMGRYSRSPPRRDEDKRRRYRDYEENKRERHHYDRDSRYSCSSSHRRRESRSPIRERASPHERSPPRERSQPRERTPPRERSPHNDRSSDPAEPPVEPFNKSIDKQEVSSKGIALPLTFIDSEINADVNTDSICYLIGLPKDATGTNINEEFSKRQIYEPIKVDRITKGNYQT
jgi:hypothetical protein